MAESTTATLVFPTNTGGEPAHVPQLFCVLEAGCASRPVSRHAIDAIDEITLGRAVMAPEGRYHRDSDARKLVLRLADRWLSSEHARIVREGDAYTFCDAGSKNGSRINGLGVATATLRDGDLIEIGQTFLVFRSRAPLPETEPRDFVISSDQIIAGLGTLQADLNARFGALGTIATTEIPVAILGATGTGKELVARAIHQMSRRTGDFVPVNCGAIPKELAASELFGHMKGSFTGAVSDRLGAIRAAEHGTLFLDEIGELPVEQQVVLLRVLQDRNVTPIGGASREIDFRLVVATNRDVPAALAGGQFREDLWARAAGFVMQLPLLRERREDIGLMLGSLLSRLRPAGAPPVAIRSDAAYALLQHDWPQNARELEQCMRSALALCRGDVVTLADLPESIRSPQSSQGSPAPPPDPDRDPGEELDERRQQHLCALLERTGGNISEVARLMNKQRTQIQRWIKRYGIDLRRYRAS